MELKTDLETEVKSDLKMDFKMDLKTDLKIDLQTNSKTDSKMDLKTDFMPDLKTKVKLDLKTDLKKDSKTGLKTISKIGLKATPGARLQLGPSASAPGVQSAVLSGRGVFERLAAESEDTRPAAKRQLSSESAARTVAVVKKSAVRKEPEGAAKTGLRGAAPGKRRRRKDLFSGSEAFSRVDAHAIRAGAEVSGGGVAPGHRYSLRLHNITENPVRHPGNAFTLSSSREREGLLIHKNPDGNRVLQHIPIHSVTEAKWNS
jgi:hypothetical protein